MFLKKKYHDAYLNDICTPADESGNIFVCLDLCSSFLRILFLDPIKVANRNRNTGKHASAIRRYKPLLKWTIFEFKAFFLGKKPSTTHIPHIFKPRCAHHFKKDILFIRSFIF